MRELVFTSKNTKDSFALTDGAYNFPLQKPMLCPICGAFQDGTAVSRAIHPGFNGIEIGTIGYRCTHCAKCYLVVYKVDRKNKNTYFAEYYPQETASYENEILSNVSPQFIESYNQALRAELRGDIELAAIGYRKALERVVKDYAINELGAAPEEVVGKNLCMAIADYLDEKNLVATADVVRILGNDYAHYQRKYPEHDFTLLKEYMVIFVKMVETRILVAHPPVSRA